MRVGEEKEHLICFEEARFDPEGRLCRIPLGLGARGSDAGWS